MGTPSTTGRGKTHDHRASFSLISSKVGYEQSPPFSLPLHSPTNTVGNPSLSRPWSNQLGQRRVRKGLRVATLGVAFLILKYKYRCWLAGRPDLSTLQWHKTVWLCILLLREATVMSSERVLNQLLLHRPYYPFVFRSLFCLPFQFCCLTLCMQRSWGLVMCSSTGCVVLGIWLCILHHTTMDFPMKKKKVVFPRERQLPPKRATYPTE